MILTVSLVSVFSCNGGGDNSGGNNGGGDQGGNNAPISTNNVIWENGVQVALLINSDSSLDTQELYSAIAWETDTIPLVITDETEKQAHEFIFGEADRELYRTAMRSLEEKIDRNNNEHGWLAYVKDGSVAIAYSSVPAMKEAVEYVESEWFTKKKLAFDKDGVVLFDNFFLDERAELASAEYRHNEFARVERELGKEIADAFRQLYSMFDDRLYVWLVNLYEPNICVCTGLNEGITECQNTPYCGGAGFYMSNDGRDTIGFLPDIESTVQALHHLNGGGMFDSVGGAWQYAFPQEHIDALLKFAKSLQSSEDGYFYHPQWGTNIIAARRGRDLGWAQSLISECGGKPYWTTPGGVKGELGAPGANATQPTAKLTAKLSSSVAQAVSLVKPTAAEGVYLPEYLRSLDAWKAYIDELNILNDPYTAGNTLAAQHNEIKSAGTAYIDYLTSYLTKNQNQETGFWGEGKTYVTMNGFMKLSYSYSYYGRTLPNVEKALDSTIEILLTPDTPEHDLHVCNTYNCWVNFSQILASAKKTGGDELVEALRAKLLENAAKMINITFDKYYTHLQSDGTFSYHEKSYGGASQGAPTSPGIRLQGDVNATSIVTTGTTNLMFSVLGVQNVNFYVEEDMDRFLELLDNLDPVVKNSAPKVETQTFDRYEPDSFYKGVETYPGDVITNVVLDKTEMDGNYKFFGASVVKDPKPTTASDKAMKINSYVPGGVWSSVPNYSYSYIDIKNTVMRGNMYSLSFDVMVTEAENKLIAEIAFVSDINESTNPSSAFTLNLRAYTASDGKQYLMLVDKYPGTDGIKAKIVDKIPVGEWVNIKIDLYEAKETAEGTTASEWIRHGVVSINGEIKAVSEASYLTTGATPGGKVVSKAIHACTIAYAREAAFEMYLDNIHAEEFIASYEDVEIPEQSVPEDAITVIGKPAGEGVYYSSDKSGARLNFNGDTVYLPVVDSGPGDDYYIFDPSNKLDRYLAFYRTGASTAHTYMINETVAKTAAEMEYQNPMTILELDAYFDNIPANASNFMKITMAEYYGAADLYFRTDADGKINFANVAESSQYEPMEQKKWYNLRFEYYPIGKYANKQARIKVYVDGEYAIELNGVDVRYFSSYTTARHKCTFQLQSTAPHGVFVYDNFYYGYEDKAYEIFKEPVPDGLPTISGAHTGGEYFNSSSATGNKYGYDANTPKPVPATSGAMSKTYITEDGYIWFYNTNTSLANEYLVYSNPAIPSAKDLMYVFETDLAVGNIPADKAYSAFFVVRANNFTASIYYGTNSAGDICFPHATGSDKSFSFKQNEWHNVRFELYYLSDMVYSGAIFVKVFVDGEFACDIQAVDVKANNKNDTLIYLQNISDNAWIAYDNIYIGFGDKAYAPADGVVVPEEPERLPDPSTRVDSPAGITGTHAGGAVFNSDAIGKRYSFDADTDLPLATSSTANIISYITKDKFDLLTYRAISQSQVKIAFNAPTAEEKTTRKGNVFEADVVFGGMDNVTTSPLIARFILYTQDGGKTSVYVKYNAADGTVTIPGAGSAVGGDAISFKCGEWNNIRFEYWYYEGATWVKVYLNGVYAFDTKGADYSTASENRVDFYTHDSLSTVWVGLDNIYTGYTSVEYSEPAVAPPSGGDTPTPDPKPDTPVTPSVNTYVDFEDGNIPSTIKTTSDKFKVTLAVESFLESKRLKVSYPDGVDNGGNNEWSFYPSGYEANSNVLVFESDIVISPAESTNGTYGLTFRTSSATLLRFVITAKDGKVTSYENNSGLSGMILGNTNEVIKLKLVYRVVVSGDSFYPSADVYVGGEKIATVTSNTAAAEADILPSKIARIHMTRNPSIDGVIYFDNYRLVGLYEAPLPPETEGGYLATFENGVTAGVVTDITETAALVAEIVASPAVRYEGDKALMITTVGTGASVGKTVVPLMSGNNGDCYVFETDFYYTKGKSTGAFATLVFKNADGTQVFKYSYQLVQSAAESSAGYIRIMCNGGDNSNGNYLYIGGSNTAGKWVRIRIEMYLVDGKWKAQYFMDGVFIGEDLSSSKVSSQVALATLEILHTSRNFTSYYDNISFVREDRKYSSEPETKAPAINGAQGNGVYYKSAEDADYVVDFDVDFISNGNGRKNINYDVGPTVTSNHLTTSAFNANGYAYAYKTGLAYKDDGEVDKNYHATIKYAGIGAPADSSYKTIIELDMAVLTPDSSLPIVFSYRANGVSADFYMGYSKSGDTETLKFNNVELLDGKSADIALGQWYNVRLEVDPATLNIPEGQTKGSVKADLYINGEMVGTISGLDAKAYSSTPYFAIQLRAASATTQLCYDNLLVGYREKSTKEAD